MLSGSKNILLINRYRLISNVFNTQTFDDPFCRILSHVQINVNSMMDASYDIERQWHQVRSLRKAIPTSVEGLYLPYSRETEAPNPLTETRPIFLPNSFVPTPPPTDSNGKLIIVLRIKINHNSMAPISSLVSSEYVSI